MNDQFCSIVVNQTSWLVLLIFTTTVHNQMFSNFIRDKVQVTFRFKINTGFHSLLADQSLNGKIQIGATCCI